MSIMACLVSAFLSPPDGHFLTIAHRPNEPELIEERLSHFDHPGFQLIARIFLDF